MSEIFEKIKKMPHGADLRKVAEIAGIEDYKKIIDFSSNICPYSFDEIAENAGSDLRLDFSAYEKGVEVYPDPRNAELKAALADFHNANAEFIPTNGAAEAIYRIFEAARMRRIKDRFPLIRPKKRIKEEENSSQYDSYRMLFKLNVLLAMPAFSEYVRAAEACDADIYYSSLENRNFVDKIKEDTDLVILANPDNPRGVIYSQRLIDDIVFRCSETASILVIDECFNDFLPGAAARRNSLLARYKNIPAHVCILRSFTKLFAIPGLRVGYLATGRGPFYNLLLDLTPEWPISLLAEQTAIKCLKLYQTGAYEAYLKEMSEERQRMQEFLHLEGMKYISGDVNYLFFASESGRALLEGLLTGPEPQIFIRSCANYAGLDERFYRVAVKSREDNSLLMEKIAYINHIRKKYNLKPSELPIKLEEKRHKLLQDRADDYHSEYSAENNSITQSEQGQETMPDLSERIAERAKSFAENFKEDMKESFAEFLSENDILTKGEFQKLFSEDEDKENGRKLVDGIIKKFDEKIESAVNNKGVEDSFESRLLEAKKDKEAGEDADGDSFE